MYTTLQVLAVMVPVYVEGTSTLYQADGDEMNAQVIIFDTGFVTVEPKNNCVDPGAKGSKIAVPQSPPGVP